MSSTVASKSYAGSQPHSRRAVESSREEGHESPIDWAQGIYFIVHREDETVCA